MFRGAGVLGRTLKAEKLVLGRGSGLRSPDEVNKPLDSNPGAFSRRRPGVSEASSLVFSYVSEYSAIVCRITATNSVARVGKSYLGRPVHFWLKTVNARSLDRLPRPDCRIRTRVLRFYAKPSRAMSSASYPAAPQARPCAAECQARGAGWL